MPKVLVVGALGVVGRACVDYFTTLPEWEVVALSRRAPDFETRATFISCDVSDRGSLRNALAGHSEITHVVFAALHEQPAGLVSGWSEANTVNTNVSMLANTLDALEESAPSMRHFALMHGGKAYGVHLGPPPAIPSRETDARVMRPNFYYDQEDLLRDRQLDKAWSWTVLRPPAVVGFAVGSLLSTILVVGVFAAISRELGLMLRFPGAIGHLKDACDASILAKSVHWAGQSPRAANQIFNVTNGDCFLWEQVFPSIARVFGMKCGAPHPMALSRVMGDKDQIWDDIVRKYNLHPYRLRALVPSWEYADFTFRHGQKPFESLLSTIKIRQAGFHECVDTEQMFVSQLRGLQEKHILPS
ncbi:MAG: SDR family oxidoreductase [Paraburkholderia sp.]|nr:SDR family oxidoreductase [Paraburkholderia sp.]